MFNLEAPGIARGAAAGAAATEDEMARLQSRINRLEQELISVKRLKRAADAELVELRTHLHEADLKLGAGQSGYYQLGRILVEAATSLRGLLYLVPRLYNLARDEWRARPKAAKKKNSLAFGPTLARDGSMVAQVQLRTRTTSPQGAAAWVLGLNRAAPALKARLLMEIARLCRHDDAATAIELARKACSFEKSDAHIRWLAFALYDAGEVFEPAQLLRDLKQEAAPLQGVQAGLAERIFAREALLGSKVQGLLASSARLHPGDTVLLLVDHLLPLRWSLAAWRHFAIARAIQAQGYEVILACLSRPGSAQPRIGHVYAVDGIRYALINDHVDNMSLRWLNGGESVEVHNASAGLKIRAIIASSRSAIMVKAMQLAASQSCRLVIDDEGDEPFSTAARIRSEATEATRLARQLKEDILLTAHQRLSPFTFTPVPRELSAPGPKLREHPVLHDRWVVGFVGEQAPDYELSLLPAVFQQLTEKIGKRGALALLMAGVGRPIDLVEDQLIEKGFDHDVLVMHRPDSDQLAAVYAAMDVFVVPVIEHVHSLQRAPIELIFAIRFGVPVVAGNAAAARGWKDAGLPIILADQTDAASLATALATLLLNQQALQEARRRVAAWNETQLREPLGKLG